MKTTNLMVAFLSAVVASMAAGVDGNSTTGGGLTYGNQLNPWFLENVQTVNYCITIDEGHFHASRDVVSRVVKQAFVEWRRAFSAASNTWYAPGDLKPYGQVHLATQKFEEQECSDATDIHFQFGHLSEEQQKRYIKDPTEVVGMAVRTNYDEVALRGKGFVYVSADSGPLNLATSAVMANRWCVGDGTLLQLVVTHELGHIFGLSHFGRIGDLMHLRTPEALINKVILAEIFDKMSWQDLRDRLSPIRILGFEQRFDGYRCFNDSMSNGHARFLGLPESWKCMGLRIDGERMSFWAAPSRDVPPAQIGLVDGALGEEADHSLIQVKITAKQRVFTAIPNRDRAFGYLWGPGAFVQKYAEATYYPADGSPAKGIKIVVTPSLHYNVDGVVDNRIEEIISR